MNVKGIAFVNVYLIERDTTHDALARTITDLVNQGWLLQGGPFAKGDWFYQALVQETSMPTEWKLPEEGK